MLLSCSGVRKTFGANVVLDGLDLAVAEHEVVALIGASGSGKSTLLRCVNLLAEIDDGTIRLDGEDITDPRIDPDLVRQKIGLVFQSYNLFPHMTVLDNITLAPVRVHRRPAARMPGAGDGVARPGSAWRTRRRATRIASPAASSSGWRSSGRWSTARACSCSTRSPRRSTRNWSARCSP